MIDESTLNRIENVLDMYGFKIRVDLPGKEVVYGYMQKDKKKIAGKLKFVLPTKVGEVMQTTDVSKDEIFAYIHTRNNQVFYRLIGYNYKHRNNKPKHI